LSARSEFAAILRLERRAIFRRALIGSIPVLLGYVRHVSLIAGTALYMVLLGGCASQRIVELDSQNPAVRVSTHGGFFGEESVKPEEVPEILEDNDIPHERVIHILLDPDVKDLRPARFLMVCLARAGYTRPVLVTKRHAEAENLGKRKPSVPAAKQPTKRTIRYKKTSEQF